MLRRRCAALWVGVLLLVGGAAWAQLVVSELSQTWVVEPGEIYKGAVEVRNVGKETVRVVLRTSDYLFRYDGGNLYPPAGSSSRSNAGWITVELPGRQFELAPGSVLSIPLTVAVPDNPDLVGSYWSVLHVDRVPPFTGPVALGEGTTIRHEVGYGIQLITHVGDTGRRDLQLLNTDIVTAETELVFHADLANPGERSLRPAVWLEVYEQTGAPIGQFHAGPRRIHPGCSVRYRIVIQPLASGSYPAVLMVDNLDAHVWAAQLTFEVP